MEPNPANNARQVSGRKAVVALVLTHGGSPRDHVGDGRVPGPVLPIVCVPTTSGTGSEATRTAVLSDEKHHKVWLWGDALKADAIVLDPALTTGLPPHLTAATGIDALVHAI